MRSKPMPVRTSVALWVGLSIMLWAVITGAGVLLSEWLEHEAVYLWSVEPLNEDGDQPLARGHGQ